VVRPPGKFTLKSMSVHFQLIPWNLLTTAYDSIVADYKQLPAMTYLDLLTELQNLPEEDLLKPVTIYDVDCEDYSQSFSFDCNREVPNIII